MLAGARTFLASAALDGRELTISELQTVKGAATDLLGNKSRVEITFCVLLHCKVITITSKIVYSDTFVRCSALRGEIMKSFVLWRLCYYYIKHVELHGIKLLVISLSKV